MGVIGLLVMGLGIFEKAFTDEIIFIQSIWSVNAFFVGEVMWFG
jgi:hypothetical protein